MQKKLTSFEKMSFFVSEVPDILISNELLEDMRKLADLYDYFKLTGAGDWEPEKKIGLYSDSDNCDVVYLFTIPNPVFKCILYFFLWSTIAFCEMQIKSSFNLLDVNFFSFGPPSWLGIPFVRV